MRYIIRFNEAAPDRTLAPSELRTLLIPRALDKKLRTYPNEANSINECYRFCNRCCSISRYQGITV